MSAFVISNGTMDRVVSAILKLRERGYFASIPTSDEKAGDKIARKLYDMNIQAVCARYGEREAAPAYRWHPCGYKRPMEWLKAVQCLTYQCSEGDVPETELYQELREIQDDLAYAIIRDLPEYRAAPWDCDRSDPRHAA